MESTQTVPKPGRTQESSQSELLAPADVARVYRIPETTQAVWRCVNRYDFRRLVLKAGRSVRYRRQELESWLEARRLIQRRDGC